MPEAEVQRLIAAQAAPGRDQFGGPVLPLDKRNHFVYQVIVVVVLTHRPVFRVDVAVVPALQIDAINAKCLKRAMFVAVPNRVDHPAAFVFEEPPHRRGKHEYRRSPVTEDQQFHLAVQRGAVPLVIFTIHFKNSV